MQVKNIAFRRLARGLTKKIKPNTVFGFFDIAAYISEWKRRILCLMLIMKYLRA